MLKTETNFFKTTHTYTYIHTVQHIVASNKMYRLIITLMTLYWIMLSDHVAGDCTSITATLMEQVLSLTETVATLTEKVSVLESTDASCTCDILGSI